MLVSRYARDFLALFYPDLCLACGHNLPAGLENICLECQIRLPKTRYHLEKENPFTERFWGRLELYSGASLYHFVKGGRAQQLIHRLKYEGKKQIGWQLGCWYGYELKRTPLFQPVELILPVPLHPRKERKRGYNQSAWFAKGLSEAMQKPWLADGLRRTMETQTQTSKSRLERFENVWPAFEVFRPQELEGKHLLLVDDVLTTGATLEACGRHLLEIPGVRLSMATIAMAT